MPAPPRKTKENGFVIVVVLCMVMLLTILVVGFNQRARIALKEAGQTEKSARTLNCARAGLNLAIALIRDNNDPAASGPLPRLSATDLEFDLEDGTCRLNLTAESGKFNVNLLKDKDGRLNRTKIDQMLRLIDRINQTHTDGTQIGYGLVPAIIDWIDTDSHVTTLPFVKGENRGAESDYYQTRDTPYRCKNAPIDVTEELLLIKAITPEIFERIRHYVTAYGDGKININVAPAHVIESLSEDMNPVLARIIIERRQFRPFESITELRNIAGMTERIYQDIAGTVAVSAAEPYYRVICQANVADVSRKITAILRKNSKAGTIDVVWYTET